MLSILYNKTLFSVIYFSFCITLPFSLSGKFDATTKLVSEKTDSQIHGHTDRESTICSFLSYAILFCAFFNLYSV